MAETLTSTPTLSHPIGQESRQRRYTDADVAEALAILAEHGGNAAAASRTTGIPEATIKDWRNGVVSAPPPEAVAAKRAERAARWDALQEAGVAQALTQLPNASARDAAVVAGIAVDKAALLRGESTTGAPGIHVHLSISLTASDVAAATALLTDQLPTLTECPTAPLPQLLPPSDSQ